MQMDVVPGVFLRRDPATPAPVLFDIPRSGAEYPRDFRSIAALTDLQKSISAYVEEAWFDVVGSGATWLYALFPNAYVDPNRHELDIDPAMLDGEWPEPLKPGPKTHTGIGLIPTVCAGTKPLYDGKLTVAEVKHRIEAYWRPYHGEVARVLAGFHAAHGAAYHLSCHSMPHLSTSGPDKGQTRSDFDLGDRNGTTCDVALVEVVEAALKGFGYRVTRNTHFIGAEAVRRHGDPKNGIHSLQIEMNRSLYMDEVARTRRADFATVQSNLAAVAAAVVAFAKG